MQGAIQRRVNQWRRNRSDYKLFQHLSEVHELTSKQKDILVSIANRHKLVRISEIFVRPSLFALSPNLKKYSNEELMELCKLLIGPSLDQTEAVRTNIAQSFSPVTHSPPKEILAQLDSPSSPIESESKAFPGGFESDVEAYEDF